MVMETIRDNGHSDRVVKKCQRIAGLKALLKEWELFGDLDLDYIRGLKAALLSQSAVTLRRVALSALLTNYQSSIPSDPS